MPLKRYDPARSGPVHRNLRGHFSRRAETGEGVIPARPPASAAANGRYYALVIGINHYARLPALFTAVNDAESVASVLQSRYGFESRPLLDAAATRANIVDAVSSYRRNLGANDNLLIYYAGHGNFDKDAGRAYWLPVDASPDSPSNWISADDLLLPRQDLVRAPRPDRCR